MNNKDYFEDLRNVEDNEKQFQMIETGRLITSIIYLGFVIVLGILSIIALKNYKSGFLEDFDIFDKFVKLVALPEIIFLGIYVIIFIEDICLLIAKLTNKEQEFENSKALKIMSATASCIHELTQMAMALIFFVVAVVTYIIFKAPLSFCIILSLVALWITLAAVFGIIAEIKNVLE